MKKLVCAFLLAAFLAGCSLANADVRFPVTAGGIELSAAPRRVIALTPAAAETVFAMGYGGRVVGVGDACEVPTKRNLPDCGAVLLPDIEQMLALEPDLVITSAELPAAAAEALSSAGAAVLVLRYAETFDGIFENYQTLGTLFEGAERGALRAAQLRYFADALLDDAAGRVKETGLVQALYLRALPSIAATGDTAEHRLLERLGFINAAGDAAGWQVVPEGLSADVMFYAAPLDPESIAAAAGYSDTAAVGQQRLYSWDAERIERQSPLMFLEIERAMLEAFPREEQDAPPSLAMPLPEPPPEPEKSWWQKLLGQ